MRQSSLSLMAGSFLILSLLLIINSDSAAQQGNANALVPSGAKIVIGFDRNEYFLGEDVVMHFTLTNAGTSPFSFNYGGDYRGSSRSLRFKITATDEAGKVADDPDPAKICFGGFESTKTLSPGEKYEQSLHLMWYSQIVHPGRYIIHATHDFGWKEDAGKLTTGEATITFKMPDPIKAENIISNMEKSGSPDFSYLGLPIYLEPLMERARNGNHQALAGINGIATPEATAALIELASSPNSSLALDAAMTLNGRLPDPEFEGKLPGRGPFRFDALEARRRLATKTWNTNFTEQVRSLATNFLARQQVKEIGTGAFMIEAVGNPTDAPSVLGALDHALYQMGVGVNPRCNPEDNILNYPEPLPELLRAMRVLHARGFNLNDNLSGQGQFFVYFDWLSEKSMPRPDGWVHIVTVFGPNSYCPGREAALRAIQPPVPTECYDFIKSSLVDKDLGVCRAACTIAKEADDKIFLKPILEIIATEHHEWLLREATDAAKSLGGGFDLLATWADRLDEEKLYGLALDSLQTVIEGLPGSSSGRTDLTRGERIELRNQWKTFLAKHAEEIRQGNKFKVDDPALTPALFGRAL